VTNKLTQRRLAGSNVLPKAGSLRPVKPAGVNELLGNNNTGTAKTGFLVPPTKTIRHNKKVMILNPLHNIKFSLNFYSNSEEGKRP
jgi:hypothetical protein